MDQATETTGATEQTAPGARTPERVLPKADRIVEDMLSGSPGTLLLDRSTSDRLTPNGIADSVFHVEQLDEDELMDIAEIADLARESSEIAEIANTVDTLPESH